MLKEEDTKDINFKKENIHILYISEKQINLEEFRLKSESENKIDYLKIRKVVEPWLTALFQSEHLSLLVGTGLSYALGDAEGLMDRMKFTDKFSIIRKKAEDESKKLGRGEANFEDDFRVALKLLEGYEVLEQSKESDSLRKELNDNIGIFIESILENEKSFLKDKDKENDKDNESKKREKLSKMRLLENFLLSFASRTATRERLNIFTTNYDRFIEYGLDEAGLLTIDRFIGKINPIMRFHRIELDYHYNPPGIRGEPRYVEGVVKFTKLHGSLDWQFRGSDIIRAPIPFGADEKDFKKYFAQPLDSVVIFPNSSKAYETSFFPYSELFRDFSAAICQPNSVLVTYGYGFGDSHINRIIRDMLTIPSTHLVIISYDDAGGRIQNFIKDCNLAQLTLLIGKELGDLEKLVEYYLPKPAIDRITERKYRILDKRGEIEKNSNLKRDTSEKEVQ